MKKKITNKEILDRLTDYFFKQDPKLVAHSLANFMLDMHRVANHDALPKDELDRLKIRIKANSQEFVKFAENKNLEESLKLVSLNGE